MAITALGTPLKEHQTSELCAVSADRISQWLVRCISDSVSNLEVKPGSRIYSRVAIPMASAAPNRRDYGPFSSLKKWHGAPLIHTLCSHSPPTFFCYSFCRLKKCSACSDHSCHPPTVAIINSAGASEGKHDDCGIGDKKHPRLLLAGR